MPLVLFSVSGVVIAMTTAAIMRQHDDITAGQAIEP